MSKFKPCEPRMWSIEGKYVAGRLKNDKFLTDDHCHSEVCRNCLRPAGGHYYPECSYYDKAEYKAMAEDGTIVDVVPKKREERFYKMGDMIRIHTLRGIENFIIAKSQRSGDNERRAVLVSLEDGNVWNHDFSVPHLLKIPEEKLVANINRPFELIEE